MKKKEEPEFRTVTFRAPMHFYKAIEEKATKLDMDISKFVTACLIYEIRHDVLTKEIEEMQSKGSIAFMVYPTWKSEGNKKTIN